MDIFGFNISRKIDPQAAQAPDPGVSFVNKQDNDGALVVASGTTYGQYIDIDGAVNNDDELITRYRTMSEHPALDLAITAVVNEAIINEPENETVAIDLTDVKSIPENTKTKIQEEFKNLLVLFNFDLNGYEIFRRWYVDGRLYYHAIVDPNNIKDGIQELRYIDPRKIRKVREIEMVNSQGIKNTQQGGSSATVVKTVNEFYMFNQRGFGKQDLSVIPNQGSIGSSIKISKDVIVHITSGQMDALGTTVTGYLHKAIKPLNNLTMLEDSMVIYRLARGPERRIFYVDTSGMPKAKAEQYMQSLITNFKNKIVYDSTTGLVRDDRKFMTMFEDFWLARRDGGKGTEVTTLPGGEHLGEIEDILYMQKKLYQALGVPISRINTEDSYSLGRASEISRDEIAFEKFVTRLRARFSIVFLQALRIQLLSKNIIGIDDWDSIKNEIDFTYAKDNLFAELKDTELLQSRLNALSMIQPFIGISYSWEWVRRNVCKQTEEEMKEIDKQIKKEKTIEQYQPPVDPNADPNAGQPAPPEDPTPSGDPSQFTPPPASDPARAVKT